MMSWAARGAVDDWAARGAAGWAGPLVGRLDGLGGWMGDRPVAAAGGAHLHSVPRQHIRGLSLGMATVFWAGAWKLVLGPMVLAPNSGA